MGIQGSENFSELSTSLGRRSVSHERHVIVSSWVFYVGSMMFYVMGLLLCITTLAHDVSFFSRHYSLKTLLVFGRGICWSVLLWAPYKNSKFGWSTLIIALLKQEKYFLNDFDGPCRKLNKLMAVTFRCLLTANWWTNVFTRSW